MKDGSLRSTPLMMGENNPTKHQLIKVIIFFPNLYCNYFLALLMTLNLWLWDEIHR